MRALALAAAVILAGCQAAPAPAPKAEAPNPLAPMAAGAAEAAALLATGQYAAAAERYQQAAAAQPEDVALRFGLGVAYSHLGRRAEATEQLRWVVERADRDGLEYREARRWLQQVGVAVDQTAPAAAVAAARAAAATAEAAPVARGTGWLTGHSVWPGVDPKARSFRGEVSLIGDDDATRTVTRSRPFRLGLQYDFPDLVPGRYRLTATVITGAKHTTFWDQKVTVQADERTQLVLTASTSKISPEDFPPKDPQ